MHHYANCTLLLTGLSCGALPRERACLCQPLPTCLQLRCKPNDTIATMQLLGGAARSSLGRLASALPQRQLQLGQSSLWARKATVAQAQQKGGQKGGKKGKGDKGDAEESGGASRCTWMRSPVLCQPHAQGRGRHEAHRMGLHSWGQHAVSVVTICGTTHYLGSVCNSAAHPRQTPPPPHRACNQHLTTWATHARCGGRKACCEPASPPPATTHTPQLFATQANGMLHQPSTQAAIVVPA